MMDVEADNAFIDKWYRYWQDFYGETGTSDIAHATDRIKLPSTDYLREIGESAPWQMMISAEDTTVTTGRCHAM